MKKKVATKKPIKKAKKSRIEIPLPEGHFLGTMKNITGQRGSGIANLNFTDGSSVMIESGFGVRQLAACYGADMFEGDLIDKIRGQQIVYTVDDFGILAGFSPYSEFKKDYAEHLRNKRKSKGGRK
jgi:hypothetical protein